MTICAVAWDIDGTLVDSEPVHLFALKATCREFHVDISDQPDDRFIGVNMYDVWQTLRDRFPTGLSMAEFAHSINHNYLTHAHRLRPMSGAVDAVSALAAMGLHQVAVSNSARIIVDANLAVDGLSNFMEFSISLDDVASGKPDPEPYQKAAEKLALPPDRIVAVEDSNTGAESALAAGLRLIGLNLGDGPIDESAGSYSDLHRVADAIIHMAQQTSSCS